MQVLKTLGNIRKWKSDEGLTDTDRLVIRKEKELIDERKKEKTGGPARYTGLAISGGGIRSASFGTGVIQALVAEDKLSKIDYLSTVSGGGYIGSSLTWFLAHCRPDSDKYGTDARHFPFGTKGAGARTEFEKKDQAADDKAAGKQKHPDNPNLILDYIRQQGNYMTPGNGLNRTSLIAIAVRTVFISLFVYFGILTVLTGLFIRIGVFSNIKGLTLPVNYPQALSAILLAGVLASALWFSLSTSRYGSGGSSRYIHSIRGQRMLGHFWNVIITAFVLGTIPLVLTSLGMLWQRLLAGGILSVAGIITGVIRFIREQSNQDGWRSSGQTGIVIASCALIYGLLMLAYDLGGVVAADPVIHLIVACVVLILAFFTDLNYAGPHYNYRNRLMETFLPDLENVRKNRWGKASEADGAPLSTMCQKKVNPRPYHIINTNIVLVDSEQSKFRQRGGDSFILSPLYSGSYATGWKNTSLYRKLDGSEMTLATAMAISGAAANPHTGVSGKGITRNRAVSTLMTLLNLRLGYWTHNPRSSWIGTSMTNFIHPGIRGGLLGRGLKETGELIQLTDGGHFENLGLYELIRRELDVIIVSDAGADPDFMFGDLANAVERVRVDFGTVIRFDKNDIDIENLIPGSAGDSAFEKKYNLARRGYAIADIRYRNGQKHGTLIYIKSTMTKGLPADIYGYKSRHPKFPDQSTADQFFDESQFEAYRELGYQLTSNMLDDSKSRTESWI